MTAERLSFRPASESDAGMIFAWRNTPSIVALSKSGQNVTWKEHEHWFGSVLRDDNVLLLIAECEGRGIGLVRVDRKMDSHALISVYLLDPYTGQGWGGIAISTAVSDAFSRWPHLGMIKAQVQKGNERSLKVFRRLGFETDEPADPVGERGPIEELVLRRERWIEQG